MSELQQKRPPQRDNQQAEAGHTVLSRKQSLLIAFTEFLAQHRGLLLGLVTLVGLAGTTVFVNQYYGRGASIDRYVKAIENSLHHKERRAEQVVNDTAFLRQQVYGLGRLSTEDAIHHADRLLSLSQESFNILLYENDSLIFWTSNQAVLPTSITPSKLPKEELRKLGNGQYLVKRKQMHLFPGREFEALTLVPLKNEYSLHSDYLRDGFVDAPQVPAAIGLTGEATAFKIQSISGNTVGYLTRLHAFTEWHYQAWMLGLHLLGILLAGLALFKLATYVEEKMSSWLGVATIVGGAVALRTTVSFLDSQGHYPDLGFLAKLFNTPVVGGSLGNLLVNVVLAMWLVTYFHRSYKGWDTNKYAPLGQWAITSGHYLVIIGGAALLTFSVEATVKSPGINFDFTNVLNLSRLANVALIAMLTLMFAYFLFSHRLMLGICEIGLTKQARFTALLTAIGLSFPVLVMLELPLPLPHFLLGTALFILVYDMFIDTGESNILWLFFWLVVLSIYSAIMLFTFNEQKDLQTRLKYATILSDPRDSLAELALFELEHRLTRNVELQGFFSLPQNSGLSEVALDRVIVQSPYLYNNYKYSIGLLPKYDSLAITNARAEALMARFDKAKPISDCLRQDLTTSIEPNYILKVKSLLYPNADFDLVIEFTPGPKAPSKFLSELSIDEAYRHLNQLPKYNYAIYRNGVLMRAQGGNPSPNLRAVNIPSAGEYRSKTTSSYSELLYVGEDSFVVIVGKEMGGYLRPMSLFSYLFVWCILMTIILSLLNTWVDVLPEAIDISWVSKPDLKTKIQVGIIALVLLSFAMISYVTILYFYNSTDSYHDNRLNRKVAAILANVEHEIDLMSVVSEVDILSLEKLIKPISMIHSMDINLFDLKGDLVATSEPEVFKRGVIAPKMGAYARQLLTDRGSAVAQQFESIGELKYRTAYVSIKGRDDKALAYIGLPYYSKQRDLRNDVSAFMGTLLNVYVFLLLIAGVIAITVANSITHPLTELGDKIRRFKVDDKIQPLEWKAHDELGDLIHEFNTMLRTVESSAQELDNARRESAWREMAQQVAHEIKNPLTPMKLSIEFLRHAIDRNPDPLVIEPLIKRVSATLVEQIDNLASIATNFSTFARMPEPENADLKLDELVQSVYNLFLEEDIDSSIEIQADTSFPVYADKKLLMRVLNNLIKNAIQAIPADRKGKLSVSLQQEGNSAIVCIGDNGTGIPVDMQSKVFYPKFTTKSSGSGLGLAICRDIINASHGRIYFETEPGAGTRFYVSLPFAVQSQSQVEEITTPSLA